MYTPDQYSLTATQRALVTYSNSATGEIKVKIPSVLGSTSEIFISKIGRQANSGVWSVPDVGSQIVVSYDDYHLTNVFWMQTDAVEGPTGPTGPVWASTFTYKVGDTGPGGGIIFFVDRHNEYTGFTYLEMAPDSTRVLRPWAQSTPTNYQSTAVTGADKFALGAGSSNTADIVAQGNSNPATCAATYCDSLVSGGQSDWYLGSLGEMKLANEVLHQSRDTSWYSGYYWTSTQEKQYQPTTHAWYMQALPIGNLNVSVKGNSFDVRPMRKF
jgi:hypothetical protein